MTDMKIGGTAPETREFSKATKHSPIHKDKEDAPADLALLGGKKEKPGIMDKAKLWVKSNVTGEADGHSRSVSDYEDKTGLIVGAGAGIGGAVGTAVGAYAGYQEAKNDTAQIEWKTRDINDPKLTGYDHHVYEDGHYEHDLVGYETVREQVGYDDNNNPIYSERQEPIYNDRWEVDGYWHRFSPDIDEKKVGSYQTPEYKHSSWLNPITGALVGLVGGSAIGAGIGLVVSVINKAVKGK
ncbi:MAG: hypothetical protein V2A78_10180 [bacterium]